MNYIYFNEHVSKFSTLTMGNVCKVFILFVVLKGEGKFFTLIMEYEFEVFVLC